MSAVPLRYAGGLSGCCGRPSAILSQGCFDEVQKCMSGSNSDGSSRLPTVRPMMPALTRREKTVEPQRWQKPRSSVSEDWNVPIGPEMATFSMRISTRALKAVPIAFWQSLQWQTLWFNGLPVVS